MRPDRTHARPALALALCLTLAACGRGEDAPGKAAAGKDTLPMPGTVAGSVTGMPNPGEATVVPADLPPPAADAGDIAGPDAALSPVDADGMPAIDMPTTDVPTTDAPPLPEPGPDAAVAVLRDYYAAINAKDFARAHAAWRNNPQGPGQFAEGFAGIAGVSVEIGPPGPVDAGAGQRFIEIPVRLDVTRLDGRMERHSGRYTLQRSVVEGGDPQWKIVRTSLSPR